MVILQKKFHRLGFDVYYFTIALSVSEIKFRIKMGRSKPPNLI